MRPTLLKVVGQRLPREHNGTSVIERVMRVESVEITNGQRANSTAVARCVEVTQAKRILFRLPDRHSGRNLKTRA